MRDDMKYVEFRALPRYRHFAVDPLSTLKLTLASFFGCDAEFIDEPSRVLNDRWGIDILKNPGRGCYILSDSEALILGRVLCDAELKSAFCLHLTSGRFSSIDRLLNVLESSLTFTLSKSYLLEFEDAAQRLGDALIRLTIAKLFSKGRFDYRRFLYLIELFSKLAGTAFEGRPFSTGLILTRSHYAFAGREPGSRFGDSFSLVTPKELVPGRQPEKRFWYLADGTSSFFLCSRKLRVANLFILKDTTLNPETFLGSYALSRTLRGGDALFRVVAPLEFSITRPGGLEFVYKENSWRVRDFPRINRELQQTSGLAPKASAALLYWVSELSRRRQSSLIWMPASGTDASAILMSQNQLAAGLSLCESAHAPTVARILTSDGATLIDSDMVIQNYGCVVDSSKVKPAGVRGTGESVASFLGESGLAVKVSQDGNVKVYPGPGAQSVLL